MDNYQNTLGDQLWSDETYKDFKILVEDKEFEVHRCILSARSPVLDRMLSTDMIGNRTGQMTIVDFCPTVVQEAICFFYKGEIDPESCKDATILAELLFFGNKYDVTSLIEYCLWVIKSNKEEFDKDDKREMIITATDIDTNYILDKMLRTFGTRGFLDKRIVPVLANGFDSSGGSSWSLATNNPNPDNFTFVFGYPYSYPSTYPLSYPSIMPPNYIPAITGPDDFEDDILE